MIVWTEAALGDFDRAHDYIALANTEKVATEIVLKVFASVNQLSNFPLSGRPGRVAGTRELGVARTRFLIAYALSSDGIVILAIYHGAQKWPEAF